MRVRLIPQSCRLRDDDRSAALMKDEMVQKQPQEESELKEPGQEYGFACRV